MSVATPDHQAQRSNKPSVRRVLGIAAVVIFGLIVAALLIGYPLLQRQPEHWVEQQRRIAALTAEQREQISVNLFNRTTTQWNAAPTGAKTIEELVGHRSVIELPYTPLNIWLADEGTDLLEHVGIKMPQSVKSVILDSAGNGRLRMSCDIQTSNMRQIVVLIFDLDIDSDGIITSKLDNARIGMLPLPTQKATELITQRTGQNDLLKAMLQGTPIGPIDIPIDASDDGLRSGRLIGLDVLQDKLVITRETVLKQKKD